MKREPTNQISLTCEVCGKEFLGEPPIMCCSGRECGCMRRPIDPVVCSKECFDKIINKYKKMKTEPTEAYKMIEEDWYAIPYIGTDYPQDPDIVVDKKDVYKIAEKAFQEGQSSPKIKQLEWEYLKSYYRSDSSIYKYAITHANDFKTDVGLYSLLINGEFLNYYAELNEAKQFAQADFEERIKKCLN